MKTRSENSGMRWFRRGKETGKGSFYVHPKQGQSMCFCWTKQTKAEKHKEVGFFSQ